MWRKIGTPHEAALVAFLRRARGSVKMLSDLFSAPEKEQTSNLFSSDSLFRQDVVQAPAPVVPLPKKERSAREEAKVRNAPPVRGSCGLGLLQVTAIETKISDLCIGTGDSCWEAFREEEKEGKDCYL